VTHSKPHPEIYLRTAKLLHADPKDCVVLEDSAHGIASAKAAGMYCIAFLSPEHTTRNEDVSKADKIIAHPDELTEEVLRSL
jgi:beta-phosphoglucomutase